MVSLWYYKGLYIGFTWDEEKSYSGGTTNIVPTSCLERGHLLLYHVNLALISPL